MVRRRGLLLTFVCAGLVSLAGCGGSNGDDADGAVRWIEGPVIGYAGSENVGLRGVSYTEASEVVLATGVLIGVPSARIAVELVDPAGLGPAAFWPLFPGGMPTACSLLASPTLADVRVSVINEGVFEVVGAPGYVMQATVDPRAGGPLEPGARLYLRLVSQAAASITGTCTYAFEDAGEPYTETYELDLVAGWNTIAWRIDTVGDDGSMTSSTLRTEAPASNAAWYFMDGFGTVAGALVRDAHRAVWRLR